jgi:hypothetical protein
MNHDKYIITNHKFVKTITILDFLTILIHAHPMSIGYEKSKPSYSKRANKSGCGVPRNTHSVPNYKSIIN